MPDTPGLHLIHLRGGVDTAACGAVAELMTGLRWEVTCRPCLAESDLPGDSRRRPPLLPADEPIN